MWGPPRTLSLKAIRGVGWGVLGLWNSLAPPPRLAGRPPTRAERLSQVYIPFLRGGEAREGKATPGSPCDLTSLRGRGSSQPDKEPEQEPLRRETPAKEQASNRLGYGREDVPLCHAALGSSARLSSPGAAHGACTKSSQRSRRRRLLPGQQVLNSEEDSPPKARAEFVRRPRGPSALDSPANKKAGWLVSGHASLSQLEDREPKETVGRRRRRRRGGIGGIAAHERQSCTEELDQIQRGPNT